MLLVNKKGRIYDVPEQIADKFVATGWSASRETLGDMLSTLRKQPSVSSESFRAQDCCNLYSNYCPNR